MKPKVLYTRPVSWQQYGSDKLDLIYVPLTGSKPISRLGKPRRRDDHYLRAHADGIKQLICTLKTLRPQVLLRWINTGMTQHTHDRIREASPNTIMMMADGNEPDRVCRYAKRYSDTIDVFLVNNRDPESYRRYQETVGQADTLYDGFDPRECVAAAPKFTTDCFFAGSNRRKRVSVQGKKRKPWKWDFPGGEFRFEFISAVQRGFTLQLHGTAKEWPMPRTFQVGKILKHPVFKILRNAKIVLGCCQYPHIPRFYTRRLIHNGASGRLVVTRYVEGMEKDFDESGKYIIWFKTVEEGVDKIRHYLKDEKGREAIAARCKVHFVKHHSWEARLRDFEKIVERIL